MTKHLATLLLLLATACGDDGATPAIDAPAPSPDAPGPMTISIPFAARIGGTAFQCGQSYPGIGATSAAYVGIDFRFYIHDVKLVTGGGDVPVTLDVDAFQTASGIALLDFETGGAGCQMGSTATHTAVTGGSSSGIAGTAPSMPT